MAAEPSQWERALVAELRDEWERLHACDQGISTPNWHTLIGRCVQRISGAAQRTDVAPMRGHLLSLAALALACIEQIDRLRLPSTEEKPHG